MYAYDYEPPRGDSTKAVWIVDDDRSIRWVLEKALAREGIPYRDVRDRVRGAAGARRQRTAGAGVRHPDAGRVGTHAAQQAEGAASADTGHHHDRVLGSRLRGRRVPGRRLRVPAEAVRHRSRACADPARDAPRPPWSPPSTQPISRNAGDPGPGAGDAGGVPRDRPAVAIQRDGDDHRRVGHRQGTGRARAASAQPACGDAVRRDQHGGHSEGPARVRALRPRARLVHRCAGAAPRTLRAGRSRHAVPGRDRRHAARPAGAPAARAGGRRVLPRRRPRAAARQRADHRGHAPESRGARAAGALPRRPDAPAERRAAAAAAAARTARRHRAARAALPA